MSDINCGGNLDNAWRVGIFCPFCQRRTTSGDRAGPRHDGIEFATEKAPDQRVRVMGITQIPRVIEINDDRPLPEKYPLQSSRHPRQGFPFDPDQVVTPRIDEVAKAAPIRLEQRPHAARLAIVQAMQIVALQKWRDREFEPFSLQDRNEIVVPHPATWPDTLITAQQQDRSHSRLSMTLQGFTR